MYIKKIKSQNLSHLLWETKNPSQLLWHKVSFKRLAMVKSCASPSRQKLYWIFWGRYWGSFWVGEWLGWCCSQHTSSWLWGEAMSVTTSNGVRWCCQSDNATGAQYTPRTFDNSHQQKETKIQKWWIEEKRAHKHGCNFLHYLSPFTRTQHLPGQICFFLYFPSLLCNFLSRRIKWVVFVCLSFSPWESQVIFLTSYFLTWKNSNRQTSPH